MTPIVSNGYLLDNQKQFFTFWYKIGKKAMQKLPNIFNDLIFYVQKKQELVCKSWNADKNRLE